MFNLENKIVEWRQQMLTAGIRTPVPLEELESHLRDEIERQMKSGMNEQKAFAISVRQIGRPKALNSEFKKGDRTFMNRRLIILAGIVGLLLGTMMILPSARIFSARNGLAMKSMGLNWGLPVPLPAQSQHSTLSRSAKPSRELPEIFSTLPPLCRRNQARR